MKTSKICLSLSLVTIILVGAFTSEAVFAAGGWHGGGHGGGGWQGSGSVGIYLGAPIGFNFGFYPYPYYGAPYFGSPYYSPTPAYFPPVQPAPVIYTERKDAPLIRTQEPQRNSSQVVRAS